MDILDFAHGVGRVYESPLPLGVYLAGAGATVLASFAIRALARPGPDKPPLRLGPASGVVAVFRLGALLAFGLCILFAVAKPGRGFTGAPLFFWVGLVIGTTLICSLVGGWWQRANPWVFVESLYRDTDNDTSEVTPPWWLGPLLVYGLFWFELVSGVGFESRVILIVVLGYTIYALTFRARFGAAWARADPLSILFGFASETAPLEVRDDGLYRRSVVAGLAHRDPMPPALLASVFVVLASTTLDNARETVQWSQFMSATSLSALPKMLVDSVALALLVSPFLITFAGALAISRRWLKRSVWDLVASFAWALVPIGVAYVLAHNMPLLMTGLPQLFDEITGLFGIELFATYVPPPQLVWAMEIVLIVGGHILGVLAAHRIATRIAGDPAAAARSHAALALLMSFYTVVTLWLLSLPLVR